ncbi:hypothetical protein FSP39_011289 [Pinctada imbricata]|uniref:Uncharacterized protein n=1 Tax=Pinctada imbricata TaxID=66713 RepID=A0AA89C7A9_PINIB|nr:hypothetical protein FSP39_011289 [Pinctada imbricata]
MTKKGIVKRAWKKHRLGMTLMIMSILVGFADVVMDWKLYASLHVTEKGLVFGPMNASIIKNQWNMSWIGVGALFLKLLRFVLYLSSESKVFRGVICDGLISIPILVVYQAPKTWIQGDIARCHASSVNEVLAIITVASFFIKLAVLAWHILKACGMKCCEGCLVEVADEEKKCVFALQILRIFTLAFILVLLANTFTDVYCFKSSYQDCLVPGRLYDALTDSNLIRRYFQNVSVFLNLDSIKPQHLRFEQSYEGGCGWLKLFSFTKDIFEDNDSLSGVKNKQLKFQIMYGLNETKKSFLQISRDNENATCIGIDEKSCEISECSNESFHGVQQTQMSIKFRYTAPLVPQKIFGDLTYNWQRASYGKRYYTSSYASVNGPNIHYFKETHDDTSEMEYVLKLPYNNETVFYTEAGWIFSTSNSSVITSDIPGWNSNCNKDDYIKVPSIDYRIYV